MPRKIKETTSPNLVTDPQQIRIIDEAIVSLSTEGGQDHLPRFLAVLGTKNIEAAQQFKTMFCKHKPDLDEYLPFIYDLVQEELDSANYSDPYDLKEWYSANKAQLDTIFIV